MTTALCLWAISAAVPLALAARSYHAFTREEIESELERRIAEEEGPLCDNDNDEGSAAA